MGKVLVVDSDSEVRKELCTQLRSRDFTVQEARNGLEALGMLQENRDIEIVLLELVMPEMDGFKFSTEAWRIRPGMPLLFLTDMPILLEGADVLDHVDYFLKPYSPDKLAQRLRSLVSAAAAAANQLSLF